MAEPQTSAPRPRESKLEAYKKRLTALQAKREPFEEFWREVAQFMVPTRSRLLDSDTENAGRKKHQSIINGTATRDGNTCAAGMSSGVHDPSTEWFGFTTGDDDLDEVGAVKAWLSDACRAVRLTAAGSNFYQVAPKAHGDNVFFTNACVYMEADVEDVVRFTDIPVGQFYWAVNAKGRVDTCARVFEMDARAMEEMFGEANCSQAVRDALREGKPDKSFVVVHWVEPNKSRQMGVRGYKGKKYSSCWFEKNCPATEEKFLREAGYDKFPYACPAWERTGGSAYGTGGPGREAIGDTKSLQVYERRKAQMLERMVAPPVASTQPKVNLGPGEVTHVDALTANQGIRPIVEVRGEQLVAAEASIRESETRIGDCFHRTLWRMLETQDGPKMTATEVAERRNEKMQGLAPILYSLNRDFSAPVVEFIFHELLISGRLPPPPDELIGREFDIEYMSILAKAQKAKGVASVDRFLATVGAIAAVKPAILDKLNEDEVADRLGNMLGVDPAMINTDEQVAKIRAQKAQAQAAIEQQETTLNTVAAAKQLSETDLSSEQALGRILETLGVRR